MKRQEELLMEEGEEVGDGRAEDLASVQSEVIKGTSLHLFLHKILQKYVCDI